MVAKNDLPLVSVVIPAYNGQHYLRETLEKALAQTYPNIEIIDIQYGAGDQLQSTEITKAILTANPDIKGIFGANEGSAIGVLNAIKETKQA